jgi:hypothetical protein
MKWQSTYDAGHSVIFVIISIRTDWTDHKIFPCIFVVIKGEGDRLDLMYLVLKILSSQKRGGSRGVPFDTS